MLVKIYQTLWAIIGALAAIIWLTGSMTPIVVVAFGFVCFGMLFMGLISVLPSTVGHNSPHAQPAAPAKPVAAAREESRKAYAPSNSAVAH
jgi:hypothetical protein